MRILIVEDESNVAAFLSQSLVESGFEVTVSVDVKSAIEAWTASAIDLVLLDAMLPDGSGFEVLEKIRKTSQIPILMLTARSGVEDRVRGLDGGADDYLVKPFRLEELLARIRALLRRRGAAERVVLADFEIDFVARRVTRGGRVVFLSPTEYSMIELLAKRGGEPVSKEEILKQVWDDSERDPNVVEVYINYLRHKLERGGASRLVQTARGKGYALREAASE